MLVTHHPWPPAFRTDNRGSRRGTYPERRTSTTVTTRCQRHVVATDSPCRVSQRSRVRVLRRRCWREPGNEGMTSGGYPDDDGGGQVRCTIWYPGGSRKFYEFTYPTGYLSNSASLICMCINCAVQCVCIYNVQNSSQIEINLLLFYFILYKIVFLKYASEELYYFWCCCFVLFCFGPG